MENIEQNAKQHLQLPQQSYIQQVIETPVREIFALIATPILYASCKYSALKLFHVSQQQPPYQYEYYYKVAHVFFDTFASTIFYEKLGVSIKNAARSLFDDLYPLQSMEGEQEIDLYTLEAKPHYIANNTCYFYGEEYEMMPQKEERLMVARYKDKETDGNSLSYNLLKSAVIATEKLLIPEILPYQLNLFGIHNRIVNFDFSVRDHVVTPLIVFGTNKVIANVTLLVSDSLSGNKEGLYYETPALAETFAACLMVDNSLLFNE